jgi:DNA-directed RNA polymerase subunit F
MANKTKTVKVEAVDPTNFERIKVENTKVVDLSSLGDLSSKSIDEELSKLSKSELEYRLKFEETNPDTISKIKKLLKSLK